MKRLKNFLSAFIVVAIILCSAPLNGFVGLKLPNWFDFSIKAEALMEDIYTYTVTNGEVTITGCSTSASGDIVIPSTLGGYPVTKLGNNAFSNCSMLTSITISDSVASIGYYTFNRCYKLTNIRVNRDNRYYSSDENGVLYNKDKTMLIQYPVGNSRTEFSIPGSVTSIGKYSFDFGYRLKSIRIPDSVTSIDDFAFYECDNLTSIIISDNITSIGEFAFDYCVSLTDVYYYGTEEEWNSVDVGLGNANLTNATIHFSANKSINAVTGSSTVIDDETKTIYGLEEGIGDLEGYVEYEGCVLEYNPTAFGFGTGTTVDIVVDGEVTDTYTIVIFGDINGDGYVDAFDVPDVMAFVDYNSQYGEGSPQELAADVNGDGYVDELDLFTVDLASTFAYTIKQSR